MDPTGNFSSYRSSLQAAMSSVAQDKQQVCIPIYGNIVADTDSHELQTNCVIPVFSLLLKDIYFLNQGNKNKLGISSFPLSTIHFVSLLLGFQMVLSTLRNSGHFHGLLLRSCHSKILM